MADAIYIAAAVILIVVIHHASQMKKRIPQHNSALTGAMLTRELLETESTAEFRNYARMKKETFLLLCDLLAAEGYLVGSSRVSLEEKVFIFLQCLMNVPLRKIASRFQHSSCTISKVIHQVARAVLAVSDKLWVKPDPNAVPDRIANDYRFSGYFDNCIGALDGTHVSAVAPGLKNYRNRKGFVSTNVLGVVNFDMLFQFVHVGWEGSAHDGRVLRDAIAHGFSTPAGKFRLGDAGYSLSLQLLTPYRGIRYHLKEWMFGDRAPQNKEELFNLRHSSLRNVVERTFGVVQKRFPILKNMPAFSLEFQSDLALCCFALHNFIVLNGGQDDFFDEDEEEDAAVGDIVEEHAAVVQAAQQWRDQIAQNMWSDYINYAQQHH